MHPKRDEHLRGPFIVASPLRVLGHVGRTSELGLVAVAREVLGKHGGANDSQRTLVVPHQDVLLDPGHEADEVADLGFSRYDTKEPRHVDLGSRRIHLE